VRASRRSFSVSAAASNGGLAIDLRGERPRQTLQPQEADLVPHAPISCAATSCRQEGLHRRRRR
jgi:hypothetical protein